MKMLFLFFYRIFNPTIFEANYSKPGQTISIKLVEENALGYSAKILHQEMGKVRLAFKEVAAYLLAKFLHCVSIILIY